MARSSVEGLNEFRRHMAGHEGAYALIGGTACSILLSDADLPFRATRDLDTVLVADGRLPETARAIWSLVRDGGYRCGWGKREDAHYYRFTEPNAPGYPTMIELFSKRPTFVDEFASIEVAPLHIDDEVSSLSAILLNDEYYAFMLEGIETIDGISILDEAHLIPFKAKAYLDLSQRKSEGEQIDSRKIRKHKLDVFRLSQLLSDNERSNLSPNIAIDMNKFLAACESNPLAQNQLKQIGLRDMSFNDIVRLLRRTYEI